jgi:tRNA threonylcarbamoyladenosine biosynthesis protein TsaE
MSYSVMCNNLEDTEKLAERFSKVVTEGAFVCLLGDVGAGKTAFTKFLCKYLGVKEKVTSPSFVIINEYKSGILPVYHFDLYRLENEGVSTIINELEEYSEGKILTLVEWAEFSQNELPFDRIEIHINYIGETQREFVFSSVGEKSDLILKRLEQC